MGRKSVHDGIIHFRLSAGMLRRLEGDATRLGMGTSEWLRAAVRAYLPPEARDAKGNSFGEAQCGQPIVERRVIPPYPRDTRGIV
jgi:hypothetical protein